MIPIFHPYRGANKEILKELKNTLDSRWWGQGPKVDLVEKEFGKRFGYKYPLFVNSGTSALELAYHMIGLKKGDEVIVPVLNCTAGQTGLLRRGVKIIFADIDTQLNIDWCDLEHKITKKTKAIIVVYLGGVLVNEEVFKVARKHKIPVIVDAAQHHSPVELSGDYVAYSFQAIKHITTGDGGMLCLKNKKNYKRAKLLRWFGINREQKAKKGWQAWQRRQMTFDIEEAGYKMQPTDIDASFMLVMLKHLDKIIEYRKGLVKEYMKQLENVKGVMNFITGGSYWLFGIVCEDRDRLAEYLKNSSIECNLVHLRNDIFKIFGGERKKDLTIMNWFEDKYLYLPLNTEISIKDVKFVCKKIREYYGSRN